MDNKENNINEEFEIFDEVHQNQLDDIVLEKYEKKEKLKKIAIIAGSILVVFLIVIFIVKLVTDSSSAPQDTLVEEQIPQEISTQQEPQVNNEYEEEVPVINEEAESDTELNSVIQEVMKKEQNLAQNEIKPAVPSKNSASTTKVKETTVKMNKVTAKPNIAKTTKKTKNIEKTSNRPKKTATAATKTSRPKVVKTAANGHYYIQVGAFMKYDPDKRFLAKIKSHGYEYKIKEFDKNGIKIKRVYIGPFADRSSAKKALASIKKTIASGAFIVRL